MKLSFLLQASKNKLAELDYARHMPEAYVKRMKRLNPLREFDNRLGAPKITITRLPKGDYVPTHERPWEQMTAVESNHRARTRFHKLLNNKFFASRRNTVTVIPSEKWTFYPGDTVQVMVGRDKGKQGIVSHVNKENSAVFVDGLHLKLEYHDSEQLKMMGNSYQFKMQPLYPVKGQVQLVDPNDGEPCKADWIQEGEQFSRVSRRTGYKIPLPSQAYVTYEYISPESYIESPKDTPMQAVMRRTFEPKLKTFEDDVSESLGLKQLPPSKKTYWY